MCKGTCDDETAGNESFTAVWLTLERVHVLLTKHFLIHCSATNFLTIRHVLCITAFCIRICRAVLLLTL